MTTLYWIIIIGQTYVGIGPNVRVDDDIGGWPQEMPSLAISPDGDTIYCVFLDNRYGYHDFPGLTLAKSSDQGETWYENLLIYYGEWEAKVAPHIVVDSQNWLHVVYGSLSPGGVWYTKSTNGGINWTSPVLISDTMSYMQGGLAFAIDNNDNLYVMWRYYYEGVSDGYDIFFTKSMDHGTSWLRPNVIVNDTVSCDNLCPSFCLGGPDTIYAVWKDNRLTSDWDIFFSLSTDGGVTWSFPNIKVNPDTIHFNCSPKIRIGESNILYCAWVKGIGDEDYIVVSESTNNGKNWSYPIIVSDSLGQSLGKPSFDIDSLNNLYIAWEDLRQGNSDIFFSFSSDSGNTWYFPNVRVNDDTTQRPQSYADLLVKGPDDIYVVWADLRNDTVPGSPDDWDIYFARGSIISSIEERESSNLSEIDLQISPNPFHNKLRIAYRVGRSAKKVNLRIYNAAGKFVKNLLPTSLVWDGTDDSGRKVPSGVYFVILKTLDYSTTQKVVFAK